MIPTRGASTSISSNAASTSGIGSSGAAGAATSVSVLGLSASPRLSPFSLSSVATALDGARGDVGAHLLAVELDQLGGRVGALARLGRASGPSPVTLSTRPPAVTISPASVRAVPAWVTSTPSGTASRPRDHVALRRALRVAGRGEHHGHRPVVGELGLDAGEPAGLARREAELEQVGLEPRQHRLRLGVAEAAVELEHLGPGGGQHQPGVEDAVEGRPAAAPSARRSAGGRSRRSPATRRVVEAGHRASSCPCRRCSARGRRRRSACSPAPARAATHVLAVAERQQRELLAVEELLEHDLGGAEAPLDEEGLDRLARLGLVGADDHALARGQPVGLEHRRVGDAGELLERLARGCAAPRAPAVGTPASAISSLAWTFEPSSRAASARGPEGRHAGGLERVDEPVDQRRLGPDDDQVAALAVGGGDDRRRSSPAVVEQPGVGGDPGVAGRAEQLAARRAERASARTIACSRPPPPTTRTFRGIW